MKKLNLSKKLSLVKASITLLNNQALKQIKGGATVGCGQTNTITCKHMPTSPVICK